MDNLLIITFVPRTSHLLIFAPTADEATNAGHLFGIHGIHQQRHCLLRSGWFAKHCLQDQPEQDQEVRPACWELHYIHRSVNM
jgi:hypothetical protein